MSEPQKPSARGAATSGSPRKGAGSPSAALQKLPVRSVSITRIAPKSKLKKKLGSKT